MTASAVEVWVWPVPDGSVEVDPVSGVAVSADEWLAASAVDEFVRSASPFDLREWYRMVSGDVPEVDLDDAWARTSRVAPRPLSGAHQLEWISPTGHSYLRNADWGPPPSFWPDHPPAANPATDDEPCPF